MMRTVSFVVDRIIFLVVVDWIIRAAAGSQSVETIQQWVDQVSPFAQIARALQ
ncbi:MAG: hypothetical protein JO107_05850 [Hyphomicrobiales bacterium]|nr:hypothetical protein [Hyphomicrobiales bacterium]MBV8662607.1 hypothetical protein [Hyphomicrobiales bacterium]